MCDKWGLDYRHPVRQGHSVAFLCSHQRHVLRFAREWPLPFTKRRIKRRTAVIIIGKKKRWIVHDLHPPEVGDEDDDVNVEPVTAVSVNTLRADDPIRHAVDDDIIGVRLQEERRPVEHRGIVLLYGVNKDREEEENQRDEKWTIAKKNKKKSNYMKKRKEETR